MQSEKELLYFEDLNAGSVFDLGTVALTRDEIVTFARQYDPQPFHLDEVAAIPIFGGLIASGWQTVSLFQRLLVDGFLGDVVCLGSPGVNDIHFLRPTFAGKPLSGRLTIGEKRLSKSRPDRGSVTLKCAMLDEEGEAVMTMKGLVIIACTPKGP
jgi:acyl dehydratase